MSDSIQTMYLVVVVLLESSSAGTWRHQQASIHDTWAKDHKDCVFFVVAGDWSKIEKEFKELQDLILVNMEESWHLLTYKVQAFYHAIGNHFGLSYDYIMKTDNDSYVFLPEFQ